MISLKPCGVQAVQPERYQLYFWCRNDRAPVEEFVLELSGEEQTKVIQRLTRVAEHGLPRNPEQYKQIKGYDNLHQLRCDSIRLLFYKHGKSSLVFTTAFRKDQQKTPRKELDRADRRRRQYLVAANKAKGSI